VSRQGATPRAASPTHIRPTHSPVTNATSPSTESIFRWSRWSAAAGFAKRGGLKQRTSTPAARSPRQNAADAFPSPPSQS
jgi:hypothetical protein